VVLGFRLLFGSGGQGVSRLLSTSFADLSGSPRSLAEWSNRVILVNFWATWCAPCREEMPLLSEVRDRYASSGLEVVGIAIDTASKVREFLRSTPVSYPVLLADADGLDLMRALGNTAGGLPFTLLIDRKGEVTWYKLGLLKKEELEAKVRGALG